MTYYNDGILSLKTCCGTPTILHIFHCIPEIILLLLKDFDGNVMWPLVHVVYLPGFSGILNSFPRSTSKNMAPNAPRWEPTRNVRNVADWIDD